MTPSPGPPELARGPLEPRLEALELELDVAPGPLLPQVRQRLAAHLGPGAEALRWAITAASSPSPPGRPRLTLEAVVVRQPL